MAVRCHVQPPSDVCQTSGREAGSDEVTVPFALTLYSALPGVAVSSGSAATDPAVARGRTGDG
jgi:hypothetical protein